MLYVIHICLLLHFQFLVLWHCVLLGITKKAITSQCHQFPKFGFCCLT